MAEVYCFFWILLYHFLWKTNKIYQHCYKSLIFSLIKKNIEVCSIIGYLFSWLMIWWKNKHCFFLLWDLLPVVITPTCRFWADFLSLNWHQEVHPIDWGEEKESFREERYSFKMREEPGAEILQLLRTLETLLHDVGGFIGWIVPSTDFLLAFVSGHIQRCKKNFFETALMYISK